MADSLIAMARDRAQAAPDATAYAFLGDDGGDVGRLTCGELDAQARRVAGRLQANCRPGDRVLILLPAGLDFVVAFFGAIYAGAIAVPCQAPGPGRAAGRDNRFRAIVRDSEPGVVISRADLIETLPERAGAAVGAPEPLWLDIEDLKMADEGWQEPGRCASDPAFLQYTSGSTAAPKGVVISHRNILANCDAIRSSFGHAPGTHMVSWLPLYHDMGLIGCVIQPLFSGMSTELMAPQTFMRNPLLWLQAISRRADRRVTSGAPNFAFQHCVDRVRAEDIPTLDLSGWAVAFSGSETVRAETLDAFCASFAPARFRRSALFPCYGLAEATLFVSGGPAGAGPHELPVEAAALADGRVVVATGQDRAHRLVSCGRIAEGTEVRVVDPKSWSPMAEGGVGEIWARSAGIGEAYWANEDATAVTFVGDPQAGGGRFLRTGDLGALIDGELYVAGRLKDLLVVQGASIYPQDVEYAAERAHIALRPGACVAFAADAIGDGAVAVVAELQPRYAAALAQRSERSSALREEIVLAVRSAVVRDTSIALQDVVLAAPRTVPRTSSGKLQRQAARSLYRAGEIQVGAFRAEALVDAL